MTTPAELAELGFEALVVAPGRYWRRRDGALVILDGTTASVWDATADDFVPLDIAGAQLALEL